MEPLLYFLFSAGLILLMMRFGCGAHVMGHGHGQHDGSHGKDASGIHKPVRWIAPTTDVDPVCGMTVQADAAKSAVHDGTVYYFCSANCRGRFEAAPQSFVGPKADQEQKQMEHSHG